MPVAYACGGFNLEARFMEDAVRLAVRGNRAVVLPQGISASGARFTDGTTTFWIKGREAMFETRERGVVRCVVSGN
jgi:putative lipoprotein